MPDFIPYTHRHLEYALRAIHDMIYTPIADLAVNAWRTAEPVPFEQRTSGEPLSLKVGDKWGNLFDCAWFCFRGQIPPHAAGKSVVLLLDVNGEMLVVDATGAPLRGLTTVTSTYDFSLGTPGKRVLPITASAQGGEPLEVWADAGCNDLFGELRGNGALKEACIAICHEEIRQLYYDFEVLFDSLTVLPEASARRQQILTALHDVIHLLQSGFDEQTIAQARQRLSLELAKRNGDASLMVSAIGHAHIDLAWLWPLRETRRKGARTFATALANMERYPDFKMAASQAQLFQWMKESYPALYDRIKQRVQEGRLEPQGALWVECDTNLTAGESLIRQIMHGRRFFKAEFGIDPQYIWLPDTFGYSAALPQLIKLAGLKYFSTQKLSWSLINHFPHQSFYWQGIDGSRVLVHMLPEETYNSPAAPRSVGKIEQNYHDKGVSSHALMVFGIGDGGGGPGEEHLERLKRLKNFAGLSPVRQEWTSQFFEQWEQDAGRFATWVGELYLERHQGTLTTHGRNKWYNRRMEQALHELEWSALLASWLAGQAYPSERLDHIWKEVLLYQFHDILPGSSIKRVYDETTLRYQALYTEVTEAIRYYQRLLTARVDTSGLDQPVAVFNSQSWERSDWVKLKSGWRKASAPSLGYIVFDAGAGDDEIPTVHATSTHLENERLRVRFNDNGAIISIYDKEAQIEIIPPGEQANKLAVYRDLGDAWDFPMDYAESAPRYMELVSASAEVDGPEARLKQEYRLGHSRLWQTIRLRAGSACLEFDTQASWRETEAMLRVQFPVDIYAEEASYDIQFGHLRRPTHRNTTWDLARDEVCGQKWADLSNRDYGVALFNDSKYGYKVKGNVLDLNLIRSVPYPGSKLLADPNVQPGEPNHAFTDQTNHTFRYAVFPHTGDAVTGGVIHKAYEFNFPLQPLEVGRHPGELPLHSTFLQISSPNIIAETIKQADESADWIVRLYEASGSRTQAQVQFILPVWRVAEVNLMEEPIGQLPIEQGRVNLTFHPFEIKTLRMTC